MGKTVFLDRDGTINIEKNYLYKIEDFEFIEGAIEAIKKLKNNGFQVIVISNQAGIARGFYEEEDVEKLHRYINRQLEQHGTKIDGFYYCPHHPNAGNKEYKKICHCRKPDTGLFEKASKDFKVLKEESYMIGDKGTDIKAGNDFGIQTILVGTGYGMSEKGNEEMPYHYYAKNLLCAANLIIRKNDEKKSEMELNLLEERYPVLKVCRKDIWNAFIMMRESFLEGGKLLIAGNGGSEADAQHIVGELMKGFVLKRPLNLEMKDKLCDVNKEYGKELAMKLQQALPAMALSSHNALSTAFMNDVDASMVYAQQMNGYGCKNDIFLGISTSGNSKNIIMAAITAKAKGLKIIGLTGDDGGKLNAYADVMIKAPAKHTYQIQELHLPIYHTLCLMLENYFFKKCKEDADL